MDGIQEAIQVRIHAGPNCPVCGVEISTGIFNLAMEATCGRCSAWARKAIEAHERDNQDPWDLVVRC